MLLLAVAALLGAAVLGVGAFGKVQTNGAFQDPAADSTTAQHLLDDRFGGADNVVLLVHARAGTIDDAGVRAAGTAAAHRLSTTPGVTGVVSYWGSHDPALRSTDGRYALVIGTERTTDELGADTLASLAATDAAATVTVGGGAAVNHDVTAQVGKSLVTAELIAVPIILVLLVIAFGSLIAALLPLAIGAIAITGTFAELFLLGSVTPVAVYAINLTTALGLSLAIDYALLMVSRYREELAGGKDPTEAVIRAVATAGRTIVFSGATVAAALAVLLIFPLYFLRSFAYAGIGVVLISIVAAVLVLPALLAVLGERVNAGRWPRAKRRMPQTAAPLWGRVADLAMRRPARVALPVVVLLLLVASPLLHVSFGTPDDRVLRTDTSSRVVGDALRSDFSAELASGIDVVTEGRVSGTALQRYATTLSELPRVAQVQTSLGTYADGRLQSPLRDSRLASAGSQRLKVVPSVDPRSAAAQDLVRDIRSWPGPQDSAVHVGGQTAQLIDSKHAIGSRIPLAALLIVLTTFVVLFLFTGSVLQPVRSLLLNLLTLSATGGLLVSIFQDGHLAGMLHFTPLPLDTSMLMLLFCIAFGLSMDYEVIVLSRIKELHDRGFDNHTAVVEGLTRSGRIVTTAAVLVAVSFLAFGTSTVSFLQLFGIGAGVAVLIDATLVRAVLVPACQRLLGRAAWWSPPTLRRLHARLGVAESPVNDVAAESDPAAGLSKIG
ncbi:MAG TPA: MMPL family transporter [Flexivirga sp.]|uniref:MMPL family transporter n=1 Tax=Flexivirga sp. TaxID=1962927 RepID=UPI002BCCE7C5|nr:MMPL family transporter [Flexivirga sp.]HWC22831.1 MMPL family transporter [Flexivirga sp.]